METQQFRIESSQSIIDWVGRKVTGAHNGTIAIKEGTLVFDNDHLSGGRFVIDTRSIKVLDVTDPGTNAQFAGHLASDDFFNTDQYPEATLEITNAEPRGNGSYRVDSDLTIKGITHPIVFDARVSRSGNLIRANATITIGEAEEVAHIVYAIAKNSYVTGAIIDVDGGMKAGHHLN
jgi:polyisoprenoid-binding protein YceI